MRFVISCMECLVQDGVAGGFTLVTYQDSGRYDFTCSKGHRTVTVLQSQKFEVLFEIGANAINDGYYREAVTSFAASRERLYEFAMRVLLRKMQPHNPNLFEEVWRSTAAQSERQLGAFIFLWSAHYGEAPSMLSKGMVEFRNDVVHKGRIPTREEAVEFGQRVLDLTRAQITKLQTDCEKEIRDETHRHLITTRDPRDNNVRNATVSVTSIIGLFVSPGETHHVRTLEEALVEIAKSRKMLEGLRAVETLDRLVTPSESSGRSPAPGNDVPEGLQ